MHRKWSRFVLDNHWPRRNAPSLYFGRGGSYKKCLDHFRLRYFGDGPHLHGKGSGRVNLLNQLLRGAHLWLHETGGLVSFDLHLDVSDPFVQRRESVSFLGRVP